MLFKSNRARRGIALLATAGLTSSLLMATALPSSAGTVSNVLTFEDNDTVGALAVGAPDGAKVTGAFEGGVTAIVTPDVANDGKALEFTKGVAGQAYSGVTLFAPSNQTLTDETNKTISFDYYSPDAVASPIVLQLERAIEPNYGEFAVKKTLVAQQGWNEFTVDVTTMSNYEASRDLIKVILFPNFGTAEGATVAALGGKYLIDNFSITGNEEEPVAALTPAVKLTFEDSDEVGALAYGEPTAQKAAGSFNMDLTGQGTPPVARTGKALEFNKAAAAADYAGFIAYNAGEGNAISDSTHKIVQFDMYSPHTAAIPVIVKLELGVNAAVKTVAVRKGWNVVTIDVSTMDNYNPNLDYQNLVIIPNLGTATGATVQANVGQKYYFDNIVMNVNPAVKVTSPSISGTAKKGRTLTASAGTWTGTDVVASYQWYRCTKKAYTTKSSAPSSSDKCTKLSGKTSATYKLTSSDRGKYMRVTVKGTTLLGSVYATSKTTSKVG